MSRFFKNHWFRRRDPNREIGSTTPNAFVKPVPEVAPELLRNDTVLNASQTSATNNVTSNSKSRHRQNRKSKFNSNSPNQNNFSKFSPRSEKCRNKSPSDEPLPPLSWTVHPPVLKQTIPASKINEDDKADTASASSIESSRSRGSSVSSENKESDRKKTNEDESRKKRLLLFLFCIQLCLFDFKLKL